MKHQALFILLVSAAVWASGCATYDRHGLEPARARQVEQASRRPELALSRETEEAILALDPEQVSEPQIRSVLTRAPAPRIINIHGGIYPVHERMISFSEFLTGMGYPVASLTNAGDGTYTFSCYESSETIAGVIAWHYERDGLRPMIVGHSQGGMQAVKVLHKLAGDSATRLSVWNPVTWKSENRFEIMDPLTRMTRPVVGLQVSYATAVGAGGLARILPNQWDLWMKLRTIPNSVEEFTGFYKGQDLLGGDYLGYGPANHFKAKDKAIVRNVRLPSAYRHVAIPDTRHLLKSQQIMDWINNYCPTNTLSSDPKLDSDTTHILWAAEVWHGIKKHWVLELQRLIRAQRSRDYGH